jgi:hypothetical protein
VAVRSDAAEESDARVSAHPTLGVEVERCRLALSQDERRVREFVEQDCPTAFTRSDAALRTASSSFVGPPCPSRLPIAASVRLALGASAADRALDVSVTLPQSARSACPNNTSASWVTIQESQC